MFRLPTSRSMRALRTAAMAVAMVLARADAGAQAVPEYMLKAAFLYNFALFADWPDGSLAGDSLTLCVANDSPMRAAIEEFHDRPVKGRRLVIRPRPAIDKAGGCQIVFIDRFDRDRWPALKRAAGAEAILTVTDDAEIGREGAMIVLSAQGGRMGFDVDSSPLRAAHIVLSSKLLRLARTVR